MSDSYVTSKATMKCSCGDRQAKLTVYPDRTVFLTEKPMANISDHISLYNIAPFGKCHTTRYPATGAATAANHGRLTPMPCIPGTVSDWINGKDDYIVKGKPALLKSSYCRCQWGGVITITDDGQMDTGEADLSREQVTTEEEMKAVTEAKQQLDLEAVLDGIQLALDVAGLAPGVGAIPDLLNASISALRGDWGAAGLSVLAAVPVIGDAATAAKFAKNGVKAAKKAKKAKNVNKTTDIANEKMTTLKEYKPINTKTNINNSDNIYTFPDKKTANAKLSQNNAIQKQDNVVKFDKYERKVEKQLNAPATKADISSHNSKNEVPKLNAHKETKMQKEMKKYSTKSKEKITVIEGGKQDDVSLKKAVGQNSNTIYNYNDGVNRTNRSVYSYRTVNTVNSNSINSVEKVAQIQPNKPIAKGPEKNLNDIKKENECILEFKSKGHKVDKSIFSSAKKDSFNDDLRTKDNTYDIKDKLAEAKKKGEELKKNGEKPSWGI